MSEPRDIPEDFAKWAALESDAQLGERYNLKRGVIVRLRKRIAVKSPFQKRPPIVIPEDFETMAPTMTAADLARHYDVSGKTIQRFLIQKGISAKRYIGTPPGSKAAGSPYQRMTTAIAPGIVPAAIRHLQPIFRPVYHRIVEDKKLKGQYVVGRRVLNEEEMIALAVEKGFRSGAGYY